MINKLQTVYNKLSVLLPQLKKICVNKLSHTPTQIEKIVVGINKLPIMINDIVEYEITEDDLKYTTQIRASVCQNCKNLTSVTVPDNITSIGGTAFYGCDSLTDIYLYSATPPTLGGNLAIPTTTIIHVPIGSGDTYKNATNWSSFANNIIEDIVI